MCTLDSLTLLSQVAGKVHAGEGAAMSTASFGGLNVMLMGDFHQFPPVGNTNAALYSNSPVRNTVIVGKAIYLQFETVINLTQQWQITDSRWMEILQNARQGECTCEDIEEIQKLVIANPGYEIPDFKWAPWDDVILVTPQHAVHTAWNRAALHKYCTETGNPLYVFNAEDSVINTQVPLNMQQKFIVEGR